jgi:DNA repair protein RadC
MFPPESLGDADLLTTLLAAAKVKQPRATANALLEEYGSFAEALGGATGMQEQATAYLATVRAAALRMLHGKLKDRPALSSWPAVLDYLRAVMAFEQSLITCEPSWRSSPASSSGCCSWTSATT